MVWGIIENDLEKEGNLELGEHIYRQSLGFH